MNFERILFPVDLSEPSRRVAPYVKAVATRYRAEVLMLHVQQFFPAWYGPYPEPAVYVADTLEAFRQQRRAEFEVFLSDELAGVQVKREVLEGDAAEEIVRFAEDQRVDLIMMATHGQSRFRAVLLGSVTAKVLHDEESPVWTAVHSDELYQRPPERWRRILCALGATRNDMRAARWAADLARTEAADLCFLHVIHGVEPRCEHLESEAARNHIGELLFESGIERQVAVEYGDPPQVIRKHATDFEADLVVIGRGHIKEPLGSLRSQSFAIIRDSPCPVISV